MAISYPPLSSVAPGLIKVQLFFKTWEPRHFRSHVLKTEFSAKPPFLESIFVFVLPSQITASGLEIATVFERLSDMGVIPEKCQLTGHSLVLEDTTTQAYRMETP